MAHAARIENGVVTQVIVVSNDYEPNVEAWCVAQYGGTWKQTSYHANFRKNYAGIGYTYDESRDAFIPRQPFPSWLLSEETCRWQPPVPYPNDGGIYVWDEDAQDWVAA